MINRKLSDIERADEKGFDAVDAQNLIFLVNTTKAEVDSMKKVFSPEKLNQMTKLEESIRNLVYEIEVVKIDLDNCAKEDKVQQIE